MTPTPELSIAQREPVTFAAAIDAALVATVNVLALAFGWDAAVVAGLNLALSAWIAVFAFVFTRRKAVSRDALEVLAAAQTPEFP
jgi:fatty acid desaturase